MRLTAQLTKRSTEPIATRSTGTSLSCFASRARLSSAGACQTASEEAEKYFVESLDLARRQETIAWQLRAATSLARLHLRRNNATKARNTLAPVYAGFSEGFETADLREAKELLDLIIASAKVAKRPTKRS